MSIQDHGAGGWSRRTWLAGVSSVACAGVLGGCRTAPTPPPTQPVSPTTPPLTAPVPAPIPPSSPRPPRIGLALGGGASRGFAHIGVIQVLEENGIRPDLVTGTSAGSLVAALYASGKTGVELGRLAASIDENAFIDWAYPGRGLLRGEALARYVRQQTGGKSIEQMRLPLGIVAADLDSGAAILFQRGDPGTAVRASSAVPAVFQPVRIGKREYVDGGLVAPIPVRFARQMGAELVIAVDISATTEGAATGDAMRMLLQTFAIMGRSMAAVELRDADVVVRPRLAGVSGADFSSRAQSIQAGRDAATAELPLLRQRIAAKSR